MWVDLAPAMSTLADLASSIDVSAIPIGGLLTLGIALTLTVFAIRTFVKRADKLTLKNLMTNWQLTLLGATGIVLSLASGWTTWDGMRNFTQEPLLSLMITFGIQGVMLIVAWLIGESFATGLNVRPEPDARGNVPSQRLANAFGAASNVAGMVIGLLIVAIGTIYVLNTFVDADTGVFSAGTLTGVSNGLLFVAMLITLVAGIMIAAGGQILGDYIQGIRVMARGAVLWVMFLACMATSVFFSFDSLFSTIFPQRERERAAELRAQNQVAGVVSDVAALATRRQLSEIESLFGTEGWQAYRGNLDAIISLANRAPGAIRAQIASDIETQRQRVAELEEKRATALSGQAGLAARKTQLAEEIGRVKTGRPEAAAAVAQYKQSVNEIEKRADEQRAFMLAEERGVEGSGKVGRGRMWRQARSELRRITSELEVAQRRLRSASDRLETIDRRASSIEAELAQIDGSLAQLKGEASTADQLIGVARSSAEKTDAAIFDPTASVASLENAVVEFRRAPTADRLATIQQQCLAIQAAATRVKSGTISREAQSVNCDPGTASEAAARVFALNTGLKALQARCVGGDKLPQSGGADPLFQFARTCVQDSGLPSADTTALRQQINIIELNRDDKAHRFVVTSNAFNDGNTLAYLALAIAIAIDSLVFMSGLFGANALRSPLTDVPSAKGRSARQLEAIVTHALQPDTYDAASMTLEQIHPIADGDIYGRDQVSSSARGWTHEVMLPPVEAPQRSRLIKVLNAGATIGAVRRDPSNANRYFVRGEFVEFLASAAKNAFEADETTARFAELKKILVVALQPYVGDHADVVLAYMQPINERDGYTSEIFVKRGIDDAAHRFIVQKAINAGATLDFIHRDERKDERDRFYIHKDFYRAMSLIAAEYPRVGRISAGLTTAQTIAGGALTPEPAAIPAAAERDALDYDASANDAQPTQLAPDAGDRAGPVASATSQNEPVPAQQSTFDEAALRNRVAAQFYASLEITEHQRQWAEKHAGEAAAVYAQLDQMMTFNDHLGQHVHEVMNEMSSALQSTDAMLAAHYHDDDDALEVLMAERKRIDDLLPLYMLAPGGRYTRLLRDIVQQMERAAGRDEGLRPGEDVQLARLKQHLETFERGSTIDEAVAEVQGMIATREDSKVTQFPGVKKA